MVAREFQSYAFKRSVDFLNAVDVVDAAEQLRSRGGEKEGAMREKKTHCRGEFRCPRCRRLGGEWRRQKIRYGGGSRYATQGNCCPRCRRRLEGGEQDAAAAPPGRRRTRGTRATKSTAAEELVPVLGEIAEKS